MALLVVERIARMATALVAAKNAAPSAANSPRPSLNATLPCPSTSTTPTEASSTASSRCTVGRSRKRNSAMTVANTGNRL